MDAEEFIKFTIWETVRIGFNEHFVRSFEGVLGKYVYEIGCLTRTTNVSPITKCETEPVPDFRLADDHNMPLFETSARDDSRSDHVEAIFVTLAHKIKRNRPLLEPLKDEGQGQDSNGGQSGKRILYQNEAYNEPATDCCY